jgi:hypothetical protein
MTPNLNTESDIIAFVNTVFADAVFVARDNSVMGGLVTLFGDKTGLGNRDLSRYGSITMNQVGEEDDLTSQAFTPGTIARLTPVEFGAQAFLTDSRIESDPFAARQDASQELGLSMASSIETNLLSHFDEFSGTIGTTGSLLTWGYFLAMHAKLRTARAPLPYTFVCSPAQFYQMGRAAAVGATVTNAPSMQDQLVGSQNFYQGRYYGVDVFVTSDCEAGSTTTDTHAGMFSRAALALDIRRAPRLEPERDASRRGWELNMSAVYAHGVWRKEWGCLGLFSGAAVSGV